MNPLSLVPPSNPEQKAESMMQQAETVLAFLNEKMRRRYAAKTPHGQPTAAALLIYDRIRDGYTVSDMRSVIAMKARRCVTDRDVYFMKPDTLFRKGNFEISMGELDA